MLFSSLENCLLVGIPQFTFERDSLNRFGRILSSKTGQYFKTNLQKFKKFIESEGEVVVKFATETEYYIFSFQVFQNCQKNGEIFKIETAVSLPVKTTTLLNKTSNELTFL